MVENVMVDKMKNGEKNGEKNKQETNNTTSSELNEAAEYYGNKQAEEDLLLSAQRYLNIFHQIHIFNDRKKNEFDQTLLDMPQDVRHILVILPGGRVLLEHIAEIQESRGIKDTDLQYLLEQAPNHFSDLTKGPTATPQQTLANLTETINTALDTYNQNMQKLGEEMQKQTSSQQTASQESIKALVEVLRNSNQQQINTIKSFGDSLSKAIIQSQKELATSLEQVALNSSKKVTKITAVPKSSLMPERKTPTLVKVKKTVVQPVQPVQQVRQVIQPQVIQSVQQPQPVPQEKRAISSADLLKQSVLNSQQKRAPNNVVDVDISDILNSGNDLTKAFEASLAQQAPQPQPTNAVNLPQGSPSHLYDSAMEKIKSALSSSVQSKPDTAPVSLEKTDSPISDSFYKNETASTPADDEDEWVYVDENGNPVDENGNPIDDEGWEYVDEDGNPIDDGEWEYVDENGNPIK